MFRRSGPAETEVPPGRWTTNASPAPANLPGKGMAQHPMLYIGEGYNKMFVVNDGKVIWTYSTGEVSNTTMRGCSPTATSCSPACNTSRK